GLLCTLLAWLGLRLGAPYGLDAPWLRVWRGHPSHDPPVRPRWLLAVVCGVAAGASVAALSLLWRGASVPASAGDALAWVWRGAPAAFSGAIVEEVQSRLLLVSLFVWLLARFHGRQARTWMFVLAILLASLLFGAGHLPAALAAGMAHGPLQSARIVIL